MSRLDFRRSLVSGLPSPRRTERGAWTGNQAYVDSGSRMPDGFRIPKAGFQVVVFRSNSYHRISFFRGMTSQGRLKDVVITGQQLCVFFHGNGYFYSKNDGYW